MKKSNFWGVAMFMAVSLPLLNSCGSDGDDNDNDGIDTTPITILSDEEKTIAGASSISSSDDFVTLIKGNMVKGYHVGTAKLTVNGNKTIPVTVLPKYHLYDDPICNWGCDVNYVKSHQRQGTYSSKSTSDEIAYENAGAATLLAYMFENGALKSVIAVVSTNHTSQYASYLAERYLMRPYYTGEDTYFIGADALSLEKAKTVAVLQVYNASYLATVYMPAKNYTRGVSSFNTDYEKRAKDIMKQINID